MNIVHSYPDIAYFMDSPVKYLESAVIVRIFYCCDQCPRAPHGHDRPDRHTCPGAIAGISVFKLVEQKVTFIDTLKQTRLEN
jgi:hypothetical protein